MPPPLLPPRPPASRPSYRLRGCPYSLGDLLACPSPGNVTWGILAATAENGCRVSDVAVLFDMDGLLIDSEPLWLEAETAVMARLGADWTPADQVQLLGGRLDRTGRYP